MKQSHPKLYSLNKSVFPAHDGPICDMNGNRLVKGCPVTFRTSFNLDILCDTGTFDGADTDGNIWITSTKLHYDKRNKMFTRLICVPKVITTENGKKNSFKPSATPEKYPHVTKISQPQTKGRTK